MDWFLYDGNLRYERVKYTRNESEIAIKWFHINNMNVSYK